jgi:phosphate-selective porin OprO/OprP
MFRKILRRRRLFAAWIAFALSVTVASNCFAEKIYFAGYKGGFYIKSEEEGGMELRLGGTFQTDYRYFLEDERADNGFDLRRSRLMFRGALTRWFRFGMEFEFQGNETSNIVEAYSELVNGPHALKMGQFKEPFSLEWQTRDKALFFAERSMAYSLGPKRDIGLMVHGSAYYDALNYSLGVFNGDGGDGATQGNQEDEPELAGRFVLAPFKNSSVDVFRSFQLGVSGTYAQIDLSNLNLKVKSSGMYGSDRSLYVLNNNTKFGMLYDVEDRRRLGVEAAWAWGPMLMQGELVHLTYGGLKPAGGSAMDADFSAGYASLSWCLTGERQSIYGGVVQPVYPKDFFNPDLGTWGAFCLSVRLEHFEGDKDWINPASYVSSESADAYSLALEWIMFPMVRIILDYSHTEFSDPLRVRTLPDGSIDYIDKENVVTCRFSMDF